MVQKKYASLALVYAVVAMVFGVFYREYTKFSGFSGETVLSVMHTHYFLLGMVLFLLLLLLERSLGISRARSMKPFLWLYNIGLNVTGAAFLTRGLLQVAATPVSRGLDGALSGVAGLGHILLGVSILLMLVAVRRRVLAEA